MDLYQVIRNPFKPRHSREFWYFLIILLVLVLSIVFYYFGLRNEQFESEDFVNNGNFYSFFYVFHVSLLMLMFLTTLVYACLIFLRIRKKETDNEFKQVILKRHISYFCLYFMLFVCVFIDLKIELLFIEVSWFD